MKTYNVEVHRNKEVVNIEVKANSSEEAVIRANARYDANKIKEILAENDNYIDIRELGLCVGFDEVIEYVTLNIKKDGSEILIETEYGNFVSFDTLAKYQQDAIYKFVRDFEAE